MASDGKKGLAVKATALSVWCAWMVYLVYSYWPHVFAGISWTKGIPMIASFAAAVVVSWLGLAGRREWMITAGASLALTGLCVALAVVSFTDPVGFWQSYGIQALVCGLGALCGVILARRQRRASKADSSLRSE